MSGSIKLETRTILQVPLHSYPNDFTFIVNDERFETNKIIADLLSPIISQIHSTDPTFNEYTITTKSNGDFNTILNLIKFETNELPQSEISYISEIIDQLQTKHISIEIPTIEITLDNVIGLIAEQEKSETFFDAKLDTEINFVSKHFNEFKSEQKKEIQKLKMNTIERIINNKNLSLETEGQLLRFINELYSEDVKYSYLYEYVIFQNVDKESMREFVEYFCFDDMTTGIWNSMANIFLNDRESENNTGRYKKKNTREILFSNNGLKGIFNYFRTQSNLDDEVKVTYSSREGGDEKLLLDIENSSNDFYTKSDMNSWICFEFKKHKIIPTNYTIKSYGSGFNGHHLKSWKLEISEDGIKWITVDEQNNCSFLNGSYLFHTFPIGTESLKNKESGVKYIRIQQTGPNWYDLTSSYNLDICSIEFYGQIIDCD